MELLFSFIIIALVLGLFLWIKSPFQRLTREEYAERIGVFITGNGSDTDWRILLSLPVHHDDALVEAQQALLEIEEQYFTGRVPFLFSKDGIDALSEQYKSLKMEAS